MSKQSLKQAGAKINIQNDKAIIFDTEVDLHLSTSGHYCVEIYPNHPYISTVTGTQLKTYFS